MSAEEAAAEAETPTLAASEPPSTNAAPATLAALQNYLGPLCQALLGATPEAVEAADAANVNWFASQPAGSALVATADAEGRVAFHRGRARQGASRYVIIGSTAPLAPVLAEGGLVTDALTVVLSGRDADPVDAAKSVVRAALLPLVAEVEDNSKNVAAVKRRLGELDAALARCGSSGNASITATALQAPPKIADLVAQGLSGDAVADAIGEDSGIADLCRDNVAAWSAATRALAELVESASTDEANPLFFAKLQTGCAALHSEVERWRCYAQAIAATQATRKGEVASSLNAILKRNRRFVAAAQLDDGVAGPLQRAADACKDADSLLSSLPLDGLESAASLADLAEASDAFFKALSRIKANRRYDVRRAARLVECVSTAIGERASFLLEDQTSLLETTDEDAFEEAEALFRTARSGCRRFREVALDLARRGSDVSLSNLALDHERVEKRLAQVKAFRTRHASFRRVLAQALDGDERPLVELDVAFREFRASLGQKTIDASFEGDATWSHAAREYQKRVTHCETLAAQKMAEALDGASGTDAVFDVFKAFQPLLDRASMRRAAQRRQAELIEAVSTELDSLKAACTQRYEGSGSHALDMIRDVPPVGGKTAWARQVDERLREQLQRLDAVLGPEDVQRHPRGKTLKLLAEELLKHVDATPLFDAWLERWTTKCASGLRDGPLLRVGRYEDKLRLCANFDQQRLELSREVDCLRRLKFRVPETIALVADEARQRQSVANALRAACRAFEVASSVIKTEDAPMLAPWIEGCRTIAAKAFPNAGQAARIAWTSPPESTRTWVDAFAETVSSLQEKVAVLSHARATCDQALLDLSESDGVRDLERMSTKPLQDVVDQLALEGFKGLDHWVDVLDARCCVALRTRTLDRLVRWSLALEGAPLVGDEETLVDVGCRRSRHLLVTNESGINLEPKVGDARLVLHAQVTALIEAARALPRLRASRFDALNETDDAAYGDSIVEEDGSSIQLTKALDASLRAVERRVHDALARERRWARHGGLWSQTVGELAQALDNKFPDRVKDYAYDAGGRLDGWARCLEGACAARRDADADLAFEEERRRGAADDVLKATVVQGTLDRFWAPSNPDNGLAIIIDARRAHTTIKHRLEARLADLRCEARERYSRHARGLLTLAKTARQKLERVDERRCSCRDALAQLALHAALREALPHWRRTVQGLLRLEWALKTQDAARPGEEDELDLWTEASLVEGAVDACAQVLETRKGRLDGEKAALRAEADAELVKARMASAAISESWRALKPERLGEGDNACATTSQAQERLAQFTERVSRALDDSRDFARALVALDGSAQDASTGELEAIDVEARALGEVWAALSGPVASVGALDRTRWVAFDPTAAKETLRKAGEVLRTCASKVRQYACHADACKLVSDKERSVGGWVGSLRSAELTPQLERKLAKCLFNSPRWDARSRNCGDFLRLNVTPSMRKELDAVLAAARRDASMATYLEDVDRHWAERLFDVAPSNLVRGWDNMFEELDEHAQALVAMKEAPHFKAIDSSSDVYRRRAALSEDVDELRHRLELWSDAQKRWVHLDALFGGDENVGDRLPQAKNCFVDGSRIFQRCRDDCLTENPRVRALLEVAALPESLEAVTRLFGDAQRALGLFLEQTRSEFPRFYFVGDDDLLAILGGGASIVERARPHLAKMFAALRDVRDGRMWSCDGEDVPMEGALDETSCVAWLSSLERAMRRTVARDLKAALPIGTDTDGWLAKYPTQAVCTAAQCDWASKLDAALDAGAPLPKQTIVDRLTTLCGSTSEPMKRAQLIVELAQQRDCTEALEGVASSQDHRWLRQLRLYCSEDPSVFDDVVEGPAFLDHLVRGTGEPLAVTCVARVAGSTLSYGYEYQGIGRRLIRTQLTDRCFATLAGALRWRLGGNPVGPAGTGKTESVRALGAMCGRHVVVFNCDEAFDLGATGRLLRGLCRTGAWGCFDEFNRLNEGALSAVAQQLRFIQEGLMAKSSAVEISGSATPLTPTTAVFVTMNPGYAGRSPLPETLKRLFRTVAMAKPDSRAIATTTLYAAGFSEARAKPLAHALVSLFELCGSRLSTQSHYDWGLRALGPVLNTAGNLLACSSTQPAALLRAVRATVAPRLVAEDATPFDELVEAAFRADALVADDGAALQEGSDALIDTISVARLDAALEEAAAAQNVAASPKWLAKARQLRSVLALSTGAVVVGTTGAGKSMLIECVLAALESIDGVKGHVSWIDPKALVSDTYKELLFGRLDVTTMEWTDGVATALLRSSSRKKRSWLCFDGDVDPEWAENLNSALDDNKVLTLPNGERIAVPNDVRFVFEVEDLSKATPATVSRCGVCHVDRGMVSLAHRVAASFLRVKAEDTVFADACQALFAPEGVISKAVAFSLQGGVMASPSPEQALHALEALLLAARDDAQVHRLDLTTKRGSQFARRSVYAALFWSCGGAMDSQKRQELGDLLKQAASSTNDACEGVIGLETRCAARAPDFWEAWDARLADCQEAALDAVVETADTSRHEALVEALCRRRSGSLLCGPPGSGKTMTCEHALQANDALYARAALACAAGTTASDVARLLSEHCELKRGASNSFTLAPKKALHGERKILVVFCDEINLVEPDAYGTPRALAFVRQLIARRGFWALSTNSARAALEPGRFARVASQRCPPRWVALERISLVAACNPPTDAGRKPLPQRLLRHLHVLSVGTPSRPALERVYGAYCQRATKTIRLTCPEPELADVVRALPAAMIDAYEFNLRTFSTRGPQCVYSARELTRWCRALEAAADTTSALPPASALVRLWLHEGLRLFADRLPDAADVATCDASLRAIAAERFEGVSPDALQAPLLYGRWLSRAYAPSPLPRLRRFVASRLRTFHEEALDVPLVVFDDVARHALRIDSVRAGVSFYTNGGALLARSASECGSKPTTRNSFRPQHTPRPL